jgi:hypothetical protein
MQSKQFFMRKKMYTLLGIGLLFLTGCHQKMESPPIGKIVFEAEYLSILPKEQKEKQYWVILSKVDPIIAIKEGRMVRTEKLEEFEFKANKNHYFSSSNRPKAFILGEFINATGQVEEKSLLIDVKSLKYDAHANAVDFEAVIAEEMTHWISAKPIKLLNFELFFKN